MAVPLLAALPGVISGIGNAIANASAAERAQMLLKQNMADWMAIQIPDPEELKVALDQFVQQGVLAPQLQQAIKQDPSAFEDIVGDTSYKAAQNRALGELENIGYEGGMRLQDKAALQDAMMEGQVADRSNRDAIASEMARRGLGGSGFEVASRLQSQQSGADRDSQNALKIAAQAQDRALSSIMGAGDMATKYRGQDFDEQAKKASAADQIAAFNTANMRDVNAANVGMQNRASEMNLAAKQDIANQNTQLKNQQQMYNKNLQQQNYENQLKRTAGATQQYGAQAATAMKAGENTGNAISNVGTGIGQVITSQNKADSGAKTLSYLDEYLKNQKLKTSPGIG